VAVFFHSTQIYQIEIIQIVMQSQKLGIMTTIAALLLVISAVSTITPYSVSATRYDDSNAQSSGANNDCPAELLSVIIGVQQQASANCLNDINSVQDSDGAAISSTPFNAAPSQALDLELEFGDGDGTTPPPPPPPPPPTDTDGDGIPDNSDNCPDVSNPNQADSDGDGIGDACDEIPPSEEICGDGIDNDLDGEIDENCPESCEECLAPLLDEAGLATSVALSLALGPAPFDTDADAIAAICLALETGDISIEDLTEAISGITPNLDIAEQIEACLELFFGIV
jgi:hypothetical protein